MSHLSWLEAGVVGGMQGVAELFPVSSLGHSVLIPAWVGGSWARDLDVTARDRVLSVDGIRTSAEFAQALLDDTRVAVTPGEAFDAPGFVRLSYATSMETLREGSRRLVEFVGAHAPRAAVAG